MRQSALTMFIYSILLGLVLILGLMEAKQKFATFTSCVNLLLSQADTIFATEHFTKQARLVTGQNDGQYGFWCFIINVFISDHHTHTQIYVCIFLHVHILFSKLLPLNRKLSTVPPLDLESFTYASEHTCTFTHMYFQILNTHVLLHIHT